MAQTIRLVGSVTIDLLRGVFSLADGGWDAEPTDEPVWETLTLLVRGTEAEVIAEHNRLDTLIYEARRYVNDINQVTPVTLLVQAEGETQKQAVVMDIRASYESGENRVAWLLGGNGEDGENLQVLYLAMLRTPYFEAATPVVTAETTVDTEYPCVMGRNYLLADIAGRGHYRRHNPERLSLLARLVW